MPFAINMSVGTKLTLASAVSSATAVWRIEVRFRVKAIDSSFRVINYNANKFLTHINVKSVSGFFGRDEVQLRINATNYDFNAPNYSKTFDDGVFHDVTFTCDGTTLTCYRDGTQLSTTKSCTAAISLFDLIGYADAAGNGDIERVAVYNSVDTSAPVAIWDANASDTSNTGLQPVLVDTVGANNATGIAFPVDGTAWVSYAAPNTKPVITLTSAASIDVTEGDVWDNSVITYTATDPEDGDITVSVVLDDSAVNVNVVGAYVVTLNVVDSGSLAADEVTVTVNVLAANTPTVSTTGPYKPNDTITFTTEFLTPNAATLTDKRGNILTLTGVTATTAGIPNFVVDETIGVLFGLCTLTVSDGIDSAATSVTIDPPTGYSFVDVGASPNLTSTGVAFNWGNDPVQYDQVIFPATIIIDSALNVEGNDGVYSCYVANGSDPHFEPFILTLAEAGAPPDTTKPVITLAGATTINLEFNGTYAELGATATDNIDGDLTSSIVITGSVNTALAGTYSIYYNVSDAAGNAAVQVVRSVVVAAEVIAPILSAGSFNKLTNQAASGTIVPTGGDAPTSWTITGGADEAQYSIDSSGVWTRTVVNAVVESESFTVTATNSGGTSTAVTITIVYTSDKPVLASTRTIGGSTDQAFSKILSIQGGEPATSWTLTGGADAAQYTLNNSGILTRTTANATEETETVTVTATNSYGTSATQTVSIVFSVSTGTNSNAKLTIGLTIGL